ncbi:type II toxin-antitoxin system VapC family toxin [Agrobacterium larrymoorei]|uniref:PIN domain-containing protein n=1 Tax=Agrobacterium larrymoorei TaxID=160699 RepID=A0A4D7DKD9_9HYPH|nr:PIN domain-containing protein [Agrobacterium larrymoorei]QCI96471.1 PIN domain-containing protein [Agrobacterium larrymoorei]QYA08110.1 PIN domain-containing protein [Agrobacterium larrymoorei]WHA41102.1 PIN domain-containing protein [Agrobacterium larrymoorei]
MIGIEKVYIDTNIFITAMEGEETTRELLPSLFLVDSFRAPVFVTSELTFSELVVKPYKDQNDQLIDQYQRLILSSDWLKVVPVEMPILHYAAVLRAQYPSLKLPDAIHVSTAIGLSCSHFLTNDLGIRGEYTLIHTRYGVVKHARPLQIIRPDSETLKRVIESLSA